MSQQATSTADGSVYQIAIDGFIDDSWSTRLSGMSLDRQEVSNTTITTLTGELCDQAALHGVLSTLFNHRLKVLSVHRIKE